MNTVEQAIEILKNGGVAIFPTDTAFAIACRVDDEKAVKRLFAIKNRSEHQAVPILVSDIAMAEKYGQVSEEVQNVLKEYWPGALTVVVNTIESKISPIVLGMGKTIGLRQPNHEICLRIIYEVGIPLIGTSANFHGMPTPYTTEDIDPELVKKVDIVLPGVCSVGMASTIIDTTVNPWKILRQGAIRFKI